MCEASYQVCLIARGAMICALTAVLLIGLGPAANAAATFIPGPVLIDCPWAEKPTEVEVGLAVDTEQGALTLASDTTNFAFLLIPAPERSALTNKVRDGLRDLGGKLYIGYGDIISNAGPVDIVSYDPLSGKLHREMENIPEEAIGGWNMSADGRLYGSGMDAKEDWTFGNFYENAGSGWEKRRTVYKGVHIEGIIKFAGRLYVTYSSDNTAPYDFPFVLVSDDGGVRWTYQRIGEKVAGLVGGNTYAKVIHKTGPNLYAMVWFLPPDEKASRVFTLLYRFDGKAWKQITVTDAQGKLEPRFLKSWGDKIIVSGMVRDQAGKFVGSRVYVLDGKKQSEITFLRDAPSFPEGIIEHQRVLYVMLDDQAGDRPNPGYILHRTRDGITWERVGAIKLPAGVLPRSLGFSHGRLYLGTDNVVWENISDGVLTWPVSVYLITDAKLLWEADVPQGAELSFTIRTSSKYSDIFDKSWVGPDGTDKTSFTESGTALHAQHNKDTYLQVSVHKTPNSAEEEPVVRRVILSGTNGAVTLPIEEGAGLYAAVNLADAAGAEYRSPIFKLQDAIKNGRIGYEAALPDGTNIGLQVRSAKSEAALLAGTFAGPDGTEGTFYSTADSPLWTGHNGDNFVQYRAVLTSAKSVSAPFLRKVVLVPRTDVLDHFDVAAESGVWRAGEAKRITIEARDKEGKRVALSGLVSLAARDTTRDEAVPMQPSEVKLVKGTGSVKVMLQRATQTSIRASLANVTDESAPLSVLHGRPDTIAVTANLPSPTPNWSPVAHVDQPFTLSVAVRDRYRNAVDDYTGTIVLERRQWEPVSTGPSYALTRADKGTHDFPNIALPAGEWNMVAYDKQNPKVAGTLTVNVQ